MNIGRRIIAVLLPLLMVAIGVCSASQKDKDDRKFYIAPGNVDNSSSGFHVSLEFVRPRRGRALTDLDIAYNAILRVDKQKRDKAETDKIIAEKEQQKARDERKKARELARELAEQERVEQKKAAQARIDQEKAAEAARLASASIAHDEALKGPILGASVPSSMHPFTPAADTFAGGAGSGAARGEPSSEAEAFVAGTSEPHFVQVEDNSGMQWTHVAPEPTMERTVFQWDASPDEPSLAPPVEPQAEAAKLPNISPDEIFDLEPDISGAGQAAGAGDSRYQKRTARVPDHRENHWPPAKPKLSVQRPAHAGGAKRSSPVPKKPSTVSKKAATSTPQPQAAPQAATSASVPATAASSTTDVPSASASAHSTGSTTTQEGAKPALVPQASAAFTRPLATPSVPCAAPSSGPAPYAAQAGGASGGASSSYRYDDAYFSSERRPTYTPMGCPAAGSSSGSTRRQIEENIRRIVSLHPDRDDRTYEDNEYLGAHLAITDAVIAQMQEEYRARRDARRARGDCDDVRDDLRAAEDERKRHDSAARHHSFMMHQHMAARDQNEDYFNTVTLPLIQKEVHTISEEDAQALSKSQSGALRCFHNGVLPREHYNALKDFNTRRVEWKKGYHERLKLSSLKPDAALAAAEKALVAENPEIAEAFRKECREQEARIKAIQSAWDIRRQNIPLTLSLAEREGLARYSRFLEDYEKRYGYGTDLGDELSKAIGVFSKPLVTEARVLLPPPSASEELKRLLTPVKEYTGTEIGRKIYSSVCTALHAACANSKAYWDDSIEASKIDYARDLPAEALLLADLAVDAAKKHDYVGAMYAAKALQAYVAFCENSHKTTYENFNAIGSGVSSFFGIFSSAETIMRARVARFSRSMSNDLREYGSLDSAVDLFANYLYHAALTDDNVKRQVLFNEKWINDRTIYGCGNKVCVDFVYNTCHRTPSSGILAKVREHFDREDKFGKVDQYADKGLQRAGYLYINALKQALEMLKKPIPVPVPVAAPVAASVQAPTPVPQAASTTIPASAPQPTPVQQAVPVPTPIPTPVPQPTPAIVPPAPVRPTEPAVIPVPPVVPVQRQAAGSAGAGSSTDGKKRSAKGTVATVIEEDNDGADFETGQRVRRRPNSTEDDPTAGTGIVMAGDEEGAAGAGAPDPAVVHVVSAHEFSHVQELYVRCAASADALSGQLDLFGKHDESAKIKGLGKRITLLSREVAQLVQGGAQGITKSMAEAIERAVELGGDLRMNPGAALCHKAVQMAQHAAISMINVLRLLPTEDMTPEQMREMSDYYSEMHNSFVVLPTIEKGELLGRMIGEYVLFEARLLGAGRVFGAARGGSSAGYAAIDDFAQSLKASLEAEAALADKLVATPCLAESLTPLTQAVEHARELFAYAEEHGVKTLSKLSDLLQHEYCPVEIASIGRLPPEALDGLLEFAAENSSFYKTSKHIGGGGQVVHGLKSLIKKAELPTTGKLRYVPPHGLHPSQKLPTRNIGSQTGFLDRFGNVWVKGPSRTAGEAFEWDVQLSSRGKRMCGWMSRTGSHLNVSLRGHVTH